MLSKGSWKRHYFSILNLLTTLKVSGSSSILTIPVANKIVDGAQLTVVWHVDNFKVSHIDWGVVTRMAEWLKNTYESLFKDGSWAMKLKCGMIHEYLGMILDYYNQGEVKITMYNYIRDIIIDFKQYHPSNNNARTPAANHLFKVRDDQKKLPETLTQVFHTIIISWTVHN